VLSKCKAQFETFNTVSNRGLIAQSMREYERLS